MEFIFWGLIILSSLSLLYYFIIIAYAGIGLTFSYFWLMAGVGGIVLSIVVRYMVISEIILSQSIWVILITAALSGLIVFASIETCLIYHAHCDTKEHLDYLIVLGAQVKGTIISKVLRKRLDTAVTYLLQNTQTTAIVTGGRGKNELISEADAMERYLISKGITQNRIIKENQSKNTYENILYCKPLIKENASFAIVTNGFHIYRSICLAKKQGLHGAQGLAAPTDKLLSINYYIREAAGIVKDKLLGNI